MKKALITGVAGFVGSHLAELLISKKIEVSGVVHPQHVSQNLDLISAKITLHKCDILQKKGLNKLITNTAYDYIFHLAAFSSPSDSFINPEATINNNIMGELNLLESLSDVKSKAKILIVGSSEEYGFVTNKSVNEDAPLAPESPYAVSKVAQDLLGYQFFLHNKLNIIRVRPFNHIGPRQSKLFVVPTFASKIAMLEKQGGGKLSVGNLNSWRDFTDVRDMVKAYLLVLEKGKFGEVYNIGSGNAFQIGNILNQLISLSKIKIKITVNKSKLRNESDSKIICDYSKINKLTGWKPEIPISKTLFDTIEYERQLIS